jgi:photosystem II stability/assembly factor-like uncharacterized protein
LAIVKKLLTLNETQFLRTALLASCLAASLAAVCLANDITFRSVIPMGGGCVVVYGSLNFGGDGFILVECGSSSHKVSRINIGYIKQMRFLNRRTGWAVVGGSLVRVDVEGADYTFDVVVRESEEVFLEDLFFRNESEGWACGRNGVMLRTGNGGTTWTKVKTNSDLDLREVGFTGDGFGWSIAVGEDRSGRTVRELVTSNNNGRTWESALLEGEKDFSTVAFTSARHGCGILSRTQISCTTNGLLWNTVTVPDRSRQRIYFTDSNTGWLVGASIMKTEDGGKKWFHLLEAEPKHRPYSGLNLDDLVFADATNGWAWGLSDVYRTSDGGKTWRQISDGWREILTERLGLRSSSGRKR